MRRPTLGLLVAATLSLACADSTGPDPTLRSLTDPRVRVTVDAQTIRIANVGVSTIGFAAIDPGALALIESAPCADSEHCSGLRPGQAATIGYTDILGYQAGDSAAVVYYWRLVPGGIAPGDLTALKSTEVELYRVAALSRSD